MEDGNDQHALRGSVLIGLDLVKPNLTLKSRSICLLPLQKVRGLSQWHLCQNHCTVKGSWNYSLKSSFPYFKPQIFASNILFTFLIATMKVRIISALFPIVKVVLLRVFFSSDCAFTEETIHI